MPRLSAATICAAFVIALGVALPPPPAAAMGGPSVAEQIADAVEAVKAKRYREAIRLLEQAVDEEAGNADALNYLGFSYRKLGNYDKAVSFYRQALEADPDHRGAHEYLGEAYLEMNQPAKAEQHLARLAAICGQGCEEYHELERAVDAYRKGRGKQRSSTAW